jgi:hypothetical protein
VEYGEKRPMDLNVSKNDHKVMAPKGVRFSMLMGVENI